jgi:replicative DNA helicase
MSKKSQLPPHNAEAEEGAIGALLIAPDVIPDVAHIIAAPDFYIQRNGWIFQAIVDLFRDRRPTDMVTLCDELDRRNQLVELGGAARLVSLINATPSSLHATYYARIVKDAAVKRAAIKAAADITAAAYNGQVAEEVVTLAKKQIDAVQAQLLGDAAGMSLEHSLNYYLDRLVDLSQPDRFRVGFPWPSLGQLTPYLDGGALVAVVANPGAGKTTFLEQCAETWAAAGWKVLFFHHELSDDMMGHRRMQRATGIPVRRLQQGIDHLTDDEAANIHKATDQMVHWPGDIFYVHSPGWTMARVINAAHKRREQHGADIIILDYLNKVPLADRAGAGLNSAQMRGQDVEEFKTLLEETGTAGLMAAQFDKYAKRNVKWRTLADARDTSELEDKANVGIVIDRTNNSDDGTMTSETIFRVVKCNAGQEGARPMFFQGERLRFVEGELRDGSLQDLMNNNGTNYEYRKNGSRVTA